MTVASSRVTTTFVVELLNGTVLLAVRCAGSWLVGPRRCASDCNSVANCARCCEKMLNRRRNSLFWMLSAALRNVSCPFLHVSTSWSSMEITSTLFIYESAFGRCAPYQKKGQLLYHLRVRPIPLAGSPLPELVSSRFHMGREHLPAG